jgi:ribosomal protein S18 acetylase RimI-like enzyme
VSTATPDLAAIRAHLWRAPYLHAYELGDLDPREAPHTEWLASESVDAVALIYRGLATPTLVALADGDPAAVAALLSGALAALPARFYAHLTPGVEAALAPHYQLELLGDHHKMAYTAPATPAADMAQVARAAARAVNPDAARTAPARADSAGADSAGSGAAIVPLTPRDADQVVRFYAAHYPASYFEPVNLERGPYLAIHDDQGIAAIAGVHVYSPTERVASLGNIATRSDARGRGHARRVTAALCRRLETEVDVIGLNVRVDNAAAIACYRAVGFELRHRYQEWRVTER